MPKQDKEKAKMWYFDFLDAARFPRSEQAGNPLLEYLRRFNGEYSIIFIHNQ